MIVSDSNQDLDEGLEQPEVTIPGLKGHFEAWFKTKTTRGEKDSRREKTTHRLYVRAVEKFVDFEAAEPQHRHINLDERVLDFVSDKWIKLPYPDKYRDSLRYVSITCSSISDVRNVYNIV